ncbi:MAG: response regulator [Saprospiraceae bacterium]
MDKINCILLIDDDEAINFLHNDIIEEMDMAEHVYTALNGQEGLDFLTGKGKFSPINGKKYPRPNIIFLDINMPLVNGYEFLEKYKLLPDELTADIVVMFVTTSNNESDKDVVSREKVVQQFISKPLSIDILENIHLEYSNKFQMSSS